MFSVDNHSMGWYALLHNKDLWADSWPIYSHSGFKKKTFIHKVSFPLKAFHLPCMTYLP